MPFDGDCTLDMLLEATDPELVKMELDTYWVKHGEDSVEYLHRLHNCCLLLHIKGVEAGEEQFFAEVGEGILNFDAILHAAEAAGTQWLVVEQNASRRSKASRSATATCKLWGHLNGCWQLFVQDGTQVAG